MRPYSGTTNSLVKGRSFQSRVLSGRDRRTAKRRREAGRDGVNGAIIAIISQKEFVSLHR